ncbi:hypothetical protein FPSM_00217 [Flavobacterium psychrophilum]|nr:hypothetical protein FPSM_00217 [Flavobacterium psychrophilum]
MSNFLNEKLEINITAIVVVITKKNLSFIIILI